MTTTTETKGTGQQVTPVRKRNRFAIGAFVGGAVVWILMIFVALYEMLPILWMFSTSLRPAHESFNLPPSFFPTQWEWGNYYAVLTSPQIQYPLFFFNSMKLAVIVTLGVLFTCSLAGFAFARLQFKGRDFLFFLFLASMMVPASVYGIPLFIIIRRLGLMDTHWAIILPSLTSGMGVFLMRQYFMTLPSELMDSAKIDGAGFFRTYWQIMLPLTGPGLSALGIFTFLGQWNNFYGPLLYLRTWEKLPLPLALVTLTGYMGSGSRAEVLAAVMLSIVPVLIFFLAAQRYVVQGIALTGMKG